MSVLICDGCDAPVDTDDDPEALIMAPACAPLPFVQLLEELLCESCRDRLWERQQERRAEDAP